MKKSICVYLIFTLLVCGVYAKSKTKKKNPPQQKQEKVIEQKKQNEEKIKLSVKCNEFGCKLYVDNVFLGEALGSFEIEPGDHYIKVTLPGFENWTENLTLTKDTNLNIKMKRLSDSDK